jgi:hypothetical protein
VVSQRTIDTRLPDPVHCLNCSRCALCRGVQQPNSSVGPIVFHGGPWLHHWSNHQHWWAHAQFGNPVCMPMYGRHSRIRVHCRLIFSNPFNLELFLSGLDFLVWARIDAKQRRFNVGLIFKSSGLNYGLTVCAHNLPKVCCHYWTKNTLGPYTALPWQKYASNRNLIALKT